MKKLLLAVVIFSGSATAQCQPYFDVLQNKLVCNAPSSIVPNGIVRTSSASTMSGLPSNPTGLTFTGGTIQRRFEMIHPTLGWRAQTSQLDSFVQGFKTASTALSITAAGLLTITGGSGDTYYYAHSGPIVKGPFWGASLCVSAWGGGATDQIAVHYQIGLNGRTIRAVADNVAHTVFLWDSTGSTTVTSVGATLTAPFDLAITTTDKYTGVWTRHRATGCPSTAADDAEPALWVQQLSTDLTARLDLRTPATLANLQTGFDFYCSVTTCQTVGSFASGPLGGSGYENFSVIRRSSGEPITDSGGRVFLTGSVGFPQLAVGNNWLAAPGYGIFLFDPSSQLIEQIGLWFFDDATPLRLSHNVGSVVYDECTLSWRLFTTSWGYIGSGATSVHIYMTTVDADAELFHGVHVIPSIGTALTLPGSGTSNVRWDFEAVRPSGCGTAWYGFYSGDPTLNAFFVKLSTSTDLVTWTLVLDDSAQAANEEGPKIFKMGTAWYACASLSGTAAPRCFSLSAYIGTLSISIPSGSPRGHPTVVSYTTPGSGTQFGILTFDDVLFAGSSQGSHGGVYWFPADAIYAGRQYDGWKVLQ